MRNYEDKYYLLAILLALSPMSLYAQESEEPSVNSTNSINDESNIDNGVMAIDAGSVALTDEIKNGTSDAYGVNNVYYYGRF